MVIEEAGTVALIEEITSNLSIIKMKAITLKTIIMTTEKSISKEDLFAKDMMIMTDSEVGEEIEETEGREEVAKSKREI